MLNQIVLAGRLVSLPVQVDDAPVSNATYRATMELEDERTGLQSIDIYLWPQVAESMKGQYSEGTVIGLRGYLKNHNGLLTVITQRISFVTPQEDADHD